MLVQFVEEFVVVLYFRNENSVHDDIIDDVEGNTPIVRIQFARP